MKKNDLIDLMTSLGLRATKTRGQNFLLDEGVLTQIAQAAQIIPGERLIEVGPGFGTLTDSLLAQNAPVTTIELDRGLAGYLRQKYADRPELELIEGDALELLPAQFVRYPGARFVANIPYNITTPILEILCQTTPPPQTVILTVQKELAERLSAKPRTKAYGAMTVMIQWRFRVEYLFTLKGAQFFPAPDVDSAVIRLSPSDHAGQIAAEDHKAFDRLVRTGFSQRRKMLRKILPQITPKDIEATLSALGLNPLARAEELGLEDWFKLFNKLKE
ncbi:MAG: 16S rRNA (adenine(1518)-N(6)/adenine(1519)-N(6))-dimethyltransferase RsmA [Verrucomicrobiota bacterium]|nr:16S rRNA (adenine(1518)-N(6)/adenine(1519)-N(6))-dimethyltransferase RsmA [Verrucomicrobiota bacterium]